ncbi:peptidylprolyl isomerase [Maricaulis sp.]|uniref:peptidylprolyl isomerase n=1 Tax=Maricaulis sp. TaxID=1486257 RepID=UPI001B1B795D|nr:peptidylprolyl isomerase [Maricaulis sp.]MBO6797416.1 peptidylprolyl isomerase [Maricaulis sp.]
MKISTFSSVSAALLLVASLSACGPEPRQTTEEIVSESEIVQPDEIDPVIARVNDSMIRLSDVHREFQARDYDLAAMPERGTEVFDAVVGELVDQKLLALEARSRGLHRSPEARRRMAQAEEQILGNVLLESEIDEATSPEMIERIYQEQVRMVPRDDEIMARHILVETREQADAARALLDAGEDFADLAVRISLDHATRLDGGSLGYFTRSGVSSVFGEVAFATPVGEVSRPFETEFGWHLLTVVDRRRQPAPSFETLQQRIVEIRMFERINELLVELRDGAEITIIQPAPAEVEGRDVSDPNPAETPE